MPNSSEDKGMSHVTGALPSKARRKPQPIRVNLPDELPVLTPEVSRILLDILMELKEKMDQRSDTRPDTLDE